MAKAIRIPKNPRSAVPDSNFDYVVDPSGVVTRVNPVRPGSTSRAAIMRTIESVKESR